MKTQIRESYRDIDFGLNQNPLGISVLKYNERTNTLLVEGGMYHSYDWEEVSVEAFNNLHLQQLINYVRFFDDYENMDDIYLMDFFILLHSINHQIGNDRFNTLVKFPDLIKFSFDESSETYLIDNKEELINLLNSY
jgi:hypothetical protein